MHREKGRKNQRKKSDDMSSRLDKLKEMFANQVKHSKDFQDILAAIMGNDGDDNEDEPEAPSGSCKLIDFAY